MLQAYYDYTTDSVYCQLQEHTFMRPSHHRVTKDITVTYLVRNREVVAEIEFYNVSQLSDDSIQEFINYDVVPYASRSWMYDWLVSQRRLAQRLKRYFSLDS